MDLSQVKHLISENENPKLEFKREWYTSGESLDDKGWGEFLKDIVSLSNGNVGYVGRTAYLIIGVDDKFNDGRNRQIFDVQASGMLSETEQLRDVTLRKLQSTCSPSPPDIKLSFFDVSIDKQILIIEIPPSAGLIKLDRDLNTRGIRFRKGTVLTRIGQDTAVAAPVEIDTLQREYQKFSGKAASRSSRILHNLPQPDYVRFIGRNLEIEQLQKLLHPKERAWVIVIDGIGGIGKSALALEIAHRYLSEEKNFSDKEHFDALIWVSAKSETLTAEGILPRQHITRTLDEIYKTIIITLQKDDVTRLPVESQHVHIHRALTQQRTLLIIDNLETIDDERVNSLIRELPEPTKCIVTTRHRIDVAYPIRLTGLSQKEAYEFIEQECRKKDVTLSSEHVELLFKRTGGVPLAVVWSIAQMGYGYNPESVFRRLGEPNADVIKFCFDGAVKHIKNKPSFLLLTAIALGGKSSRSFLKSVTDLSELDCDDGLVELEKLSLINKQKDTFEILPLVNQFTLNELKTIPEQKLEMMVSQIAIRKHSSEPFLKAEEYVQTLDSVREEIAKFLDAQMWGYAQGADEHNVYFYLMELEKLGGQTAKNTFKWVAEGGLVDMLYYSPEPDRLWTAKYGVIALIRLGEIPFLLDLISSRPNWPSEYSIATELGKTGEIEAANIIDGFLMTADITPKLREKLTEAKNTILNRIQT